MEAVLEEEPFIDGHQDEDAIRARLQRPQRHYESGTEEEDYNSEYERARLENDQTLKHRFEAIFEKYGRDFTGVGDEIDIETGEVVLNNGHLEHMQHEADPGKETGLSSQLMREFAVNLEHEDDLSAVEEVVSLESSSDGNPGDEDDCDDEDDSDADRAAYGELAPVPVPSHGRCAATTAQTYAQSGTYYHDPQFKDITSTAANISIGKSSSNYKSAQSSTAALRRVQRLAEESDSSGAPLDVLAMPAVQDSMLALKSKNHRGMAPKDIQALGMSIANQIAKFIGVGRPKSKPIQSKRKDAAWDYPELPVDKRRRIEVRPQRPRLPQLSAVISPTRKGPLGEPKESIWAPLRHPKPRKPNKKAVLPQDQVDGTMVDPDETDISPQFMDELYESAGIVLKKCANCSISATLCWRSGPDGDLCNACGMYWYRYQLMKPLRAPTPSEPMSEESEAEDVEEPPYEANTSRRVTKCRPGEKHGRFTVEEDALIIKLKEIDGMTWEKVGRHFPRRTTYALQCRYSKRLLVGLQSEGRDALLEQGFTFGPTDKRDFIQSDDTLIIQLCDEIGLDFPAIAKQMPERTAEEIEARYNLLTGAEPPLSKVVPRDKSSMPEKAYNRWSVEEETLLVKLREVDRLAWDLLAKQFPGRTGLSLQKRYVRGVARRKKLQDEGEVDPYAYLFTDAGSHSRIDPERLAQLEAESQALRQIVERSVEAPTAAAEHSAETAVVTNPNAIALGLIDGARATKITADVPARYRSRYNKAEDQLIVNLKSDQRMSWEEISLRMPGRSAHALEMRWNHKLKYEGTFQLDDADVESNAGSPPREAVAVDEQLLMNTCLDLPSGQQSLSLRSDTDIAAEGQHRHDAEDPSTNETIVSSNSPTEDESVISHDPYQYERDMQFNMTPDQPQDAFDALPMASNEVLRRDESDIQPKDPMCEEGAASRKLHNFGIVWTLEEHDLLVKLRSQGLPWANIAQHMPGRTVSSLRNRWRSHMSRLGSAPTSRRKSETSLLRSVLSNGALRRSESVDQLSGDFNHSCDNIDERRVGRRSAELDTLDPITRDFSTARGPLLPSPFTDAPKAVGPDFSTRTAPFAQMSPLPGSPESDIIDDFPSAYPDTPLQPTFESNMDSPFAMNLSYTTPARYNQQPHPYYLSQATAECLPDQDDIGAQPRFCEPMSAIPLDPELYAIVPEETLRAKVLSPQQCLGIVEDGSEDVSSQIDDFSDDESATDGPRELPSTPHVLRDSGAANGKPPFSWTELITMALKSAPGQKARTGDICRFLEHKFPYFKTCGDGWKSTLRGHMCHCKVFEKGHGAASRTWGFKSDGTTPVSKMRLSKKGTKTDGAVESNSSKSKVRLTSSPSKATARIKSLKLLSLPAGDVVIPEKSDPPEPLLEVPNMSWDGASELHMHQLDSGPELSEVVGISAAQELESIVHEEPALHIENAPPIIDSTPRRPVEHNISSDIYRDPESSPAPLRAWRRIEELKRMLQDDDDDDIEMNEAFDDGDRAQSQLPKSSSPIFASTTKHVTPHNVYSKGAKSNIPAPAPILSHLKRYSSFSVPAGSNSSATTPSAGHGHPSGVRLDGSARRVVGTPIRGADDDSEDELAL